METADAKDNAPRTVPPPSNSQVIKEQPYLVVGSPPCTAYCRFNQGINYRRMDPAEVRRREAEAAILFKFCARDL